MSNIVEIPKVIHYCWFGPNKMTTLQTKCLESWKKHLPEYKIIRWDEEKIEMDHPFLISAYENKKWAFVADYVRFQKLYIYGGVYLDTDMLLIKPLDSLLSSNLFLEPRIKII